jgi:hypothetical protein
MKLFRLIGWCSLLWLGLALPAVAQQAEVEPISYTIVINDYTFAVEGQPPGEGLTLQAGQLYRLMFRNDGLVKHEVLFGREAIQTDGFFTDYAEHLLIETETAVFGVMMEDTFEIETFGLHELELTHGQELAVEFTLPEDLIGMWELGCFVALNPDATADYTGPTHYDVGMKLPLEVVEAG